jgi:hypothetical protein
VERPGENGHILPTAMTEMVITEGSTVPIRGAAVRHLWRWIACRHRPSLKFNGKDVCRVVASCTVNLVALSARNYFEALWYSNYYCVGLVAVSQGGDARQ